MLIKKYSVIDYIFHGVRGAHGCLNTTEILVGLILSGKWIYIFAIL